MLQGYFLSLPEISLFNDRIMKQIDFCWKEQANLVSNDNDDVFNSICHNDFWVNNIMIKFERSPKEPTSLKIFDFQLTKFAPVTLDLIFFLFTSLNYDLLHNSFDELVKEYYDEFIRILKVHSCSVEEFSFDA